MVSTQKYVDTIVLIAKITMRQRSAHSKPFKVQVVQECLKPDVSITSVALHHGINANLVGKWIPLYRDSPSTLPEFVALTRKSDPAPIQPVVVSIDIPIRQQTPTVHWPASDPDGCALFIRGLAK